jgi:hypothetical protein
MSPIKIFFSSRDVSENKIFEYDYEQFQAITQE